MNLKRCIAFMVPGLLAAGVLPLSGQVSPDESAAIERAAPATATVKPHRPRLLLVFNRFEGYQHSAIHHAAAALEIIGKKTGAFATVQSDDYSALLPENLKRFDGICFNNTTQLKFDNPEVRKSILEFIAGGKGIVGIHAATDNFPTWPEGQELFGGVFDSHPWTAEGTWAVKVSDPDHPLTVAFRGKDFLISDEIYRIRQVGLRKTCRVLLALDMRNKANRSAPGVRVTDRDLPISWVRTYGKGRLFYCSLGHNDDVYTNPAVLRHYLDGIQFALGDLQAPTDPVPFDPMSAFDQEVLTGLLGRILTYRYGDSRAALLRLDAFVRSVNDLPEARLKLERQFCDFLKGNATPAGKQFVCEKLVLVGSNASVPLLTEMLADTVLAGRPLLALASIPGVAADAGLRQALTRVPPATKIEIIDALGDRRTGSVTEDLEALAADSDGRFASAAASALGRIGSAQSLDALERLKASTEGRSDVVEAMLVAAERVRGAGDTARALKAYTDLWNSAVPQAVRSAALSGIVMTEPANASKALCQAIRSNNAGERGVAAKLAGELEDTAGIRTLAQLLPELPPGTQVQLLAALSLRKDGEVQKAVLAACDSKRLEVRLAAMRAAGLMEDAGAVRVLVRKAATATGLEQKEARASLNGIRAPGANDSLLALLSGSNGRSKSEIIKAVAERKVPASVPFLLRAAADTSGAVREDAVKALRSLAGPEEVPAMVDLLVQSPVEGDREKLGAAVAAAARRDSTGRRQDASILAAYSRATEPEVRASLIAAAGAIGSPASLPMLRGALTDSNREIRRAAIRALAVWPTPEPLQDLWSVAGGTGEITERTLALRGSVRLLGLDSTNAPGETIALYRKAMKIAPDEAERKALLSAVGESRSVPGLEMAAEYLLDKNLRLEAEAAVLKIADSLPDTIRRRIVPRLREIQSSSMLKTNSTKAAEVIAKIELYDDYITSWEMDGPYHDEWTRLLDEPFGPELTGGVSNRWVPFLGTADPRNPWLLDIGKAVPGEDNVIYLRTNVWSPVEQAARIEAGSDAGIKMWLNGKLVHSGSADRRVAPGDDRCPVRMQKGWNVLVVKLEQGDGPWRACARVRAPDGGRLDGIRVSTTQQ